jgi:hypothetical protein
VRAPPGAVADALLYEFWAEPEPDELAFEVPPEAFELFEL